jgi:hypothetical protein
MKRFKNSIFSFALMACAMLASIAFSPAAQAVSLSDYLENKVIDHVFRGTAYTAPTTIYVALYTSSCSDTGGGTEVSGGSYARASLTATTTNWAGTQSAGSTAVSSGTSGTTSNNVAIPFATPSVGWGTVTHIGMTDALSGGNLLVCTALTVSKTINLGDTVTFPIASLTVQIDN